MVKPIRPDEVRKTVPAHVIEAFNDLITRQWDGDEAVIYQDDAVSEIVKRMCIQRTEVFEMGYLNVEPIYRAAGWDVTYDKPGYSESGRAYFTFRKR